jgi:starch-binding outer membrane protein, SusD/RagB family
MNQKLLHIKNWLLVFGVFLIAINMSGCKKFLQVEVPSTSVSQDNVYNTDATAIAVLSGVYTDLVSIVSGTDGFSLLSGLSADELTLASTVTNQKLIAFYSNQLSSGLSVSFGTNYWNDAFYLLFTCNAAINGLEKSTTLSGAVKTQLLGEAKFARALLYFYLVNYYGDVPLVLTTDPNVSRLLPRTRTQEIYEHIVGDLKDAQNVLSNSFLDATLLKSSPERIRPTKWAATALLARTFLYVSQYENAETEASTIITNTGQFALTPVGGVFLKNSTEAIWQLQPISLNRNTEDAMTFELPVTGPNRDKNPVYLSAQVLNAFEDGDIRRKTGGWVDSVIAGGTTYFFPAKYRATTTTGSSFTEYLMFFRLAEQYLIRAEARVKQNNIQGAKEDIDVIRTRAGLSGTTANDEPSLLTAILRERQVELFTELGHRWFDLKRMNKIDDVMSVVTPLKATNITWQPDQHLYPIPYNDILKNPNLTQNPGY